MRSSTYPHLSCNNCTAVYNVDIQAKYIKQMIQNREEVLLENKAVYEKELLNLIDMGKDDSPRGVELQEMIKEIENELDYPAEEPDFSGSTNDDR